MHNKRFNEEKYSFFNAATDTQWHKHKVLALWMTQFHMKLAITPWYTVDKGKPLTAPMIIQFCLHSVSADTIHMPSHQRRITV